MLSIAIEPRSPLIEHGKNEQFLNFDFAIRNKGRHSLRLVAIELSAFDEAGQITTEKTLNSNGLQPAIQVVSAGPFKPGSLTDVFNPFPSFDVSILLSRMQYTFKFVTEDTAKDAARNRKRLPMDFDVMERVTVNPVDYVSRTELTLPLRGRLLVWEGHDLLSHHRRIPLDSEAVKQIGINGANANRYASDLVIVDEAGNFFHGSAFDKTSYYTYGAPIYAPANGIVTASRNDVPDNEFRGRQIVYPKLPKSSEDGLGNYVLLDHQNGEFSVIPHMLAGSVRLRVGEKVKAGQIIGKVGFSGDAIFPHVHYSLISCADVRTCEGVPAYFTGVTRLLGRTSRSDEHAILSSGDLLMSQ